MKEPSPHLEHMTPEGEKPKTREYADITGRMQTFDISHEACEPFGFYAGDRVQTPAGPATVIGVNASTLWLRWEGERTVNRWSDDERSKADLERLGFRLISRAGEGGEVTGGSEESTETPVQGKEERVGVKEKSESKTESKKSEEELFPGVTEDEHSVSYLGVRLPKAENTEGPFVPSRETYGDYINDNYSLELQKKLAISMLSGDPTLVEGGTSIGKTTTVKKMCADLGWEVHYVNVNGLSEAEDFMGKYIPNVDRKRLDDPEYIFADGKTTSGLRQEEGKTKVIILDEYNAAAPNILIRIHEILDALERNGDIVLTEDASEKLETSKERTKMIALINPPGRGYLSREPLDPAQLRRWVYLKEPSELPDETLTYSTESLFGLAPGDELQLKEAFLEHPEQGISKEQLAEIPGMSEILPKFQEFHKAAKRLLKERKIAADQPQPFTFDDRMEPRRVRDFVTRFYTGDVNATFQEALRYYYVNKLEKEEDRAKLEELIKTVAYIPKVQPSKRKALGEERPPQTQTEEAKERKDAPRKFISINGNEIIASSRESLEEFTVGDRV